MIIIHNIEDMIFQLMGKCSLTRKEAVHILTRNSDGLSTDAENLKVGYSDTYDQIYIKCLEGSLDKFSEVFTFGKVTLETCPTYLVVEKLINLLMVYGGRQKIEVMVVPAGKRESEDFIYLTYGTEKNNYRFEVYNNSVFLVNCVRKYPTNIAMSFKCRTLGDNHKTLIVDDLRINTQAISPSDFLRFLGYYLMDYYDARVKPYADTVYLKADEVSAEFLDKLVKTGELERIEVDFDTDEVSYRCNVLKFFSVQKGVVHIFFSNTNGQDQENVEAGKVIDFDEEPVSGSTSIFDEIRTEVLQTVRSSEALVLNKDLRGELFKIVTESLSIQKPKLFYIKTKEQLILIESIIRSFIARGSCPNLIVLVVKRSVFDEVDSSITECLHEIGSVFAV